MAIKETITGPDDPQIQNGSLRDREISSGNEPSRRAADLHARIQNLKESERQLNIRCSLLQATIDGANAAIFSVDTGCRYTNFNKKYSDTIRELYGTVITIGEKPDAFVPVEKDLSKIRQLLGRALAGDEGSLSDYFGDHAHHLRFFDLSWYPVCNETGFITGAAMIAVDSTLRQQNEKALNERGELFHRLADDSPDLLFRVSIPEGKFEYASPAALAITGYPPEEFLKRPGLLYEMVHSSAKDAFGRYLDLLRKGNNPPAAEFQAVHRNGDPRWWYIRTTMVRDGAGHSVAYEGLITDFTKQKKEQAGLEESGELFHRLADDSPDLLFRVSIPEGKFEYASPAALAITGYPPEEFLKRPGLLYEMVHSSAKDAFGRYLDLLRKGNNPPAAEFQAVHKNGDPRWWYIRTTMVRDGAGHPVAYEGLITDITERKKEQAAIEETREWFRTIVEAADTGIILVDAKTHVIADANPRALEMIGAPRDEVVGSVCHRIICPAETGKCPVTDLHEQVDQSERLVISADGTAIPVLKTVVPVTISGRSLLVESFIDISEQKKSEGALRQSEERYRAFIANSSEGIFRFAADCPIPATLPADEQIALSLQHGYIAECNDAMARMYGYEKACDLTGKKLDTIINADVPAMVEYMRLFIEKGYHITDYETMERDRTGAIRWFSSTMHGVVQDDCVVTIWGVQRDITDRKNVERILTESEARYRELVEHSVDIICTLSLSGEILSVSPAVYPLLGYRPDELAGKNILEYFTPESRQRMQDEADKIRTGVRSDTFYEVELRATDGRFIPFEVNIRLRQGSDCGPDIIGIAREISERKKNEDALRESEERFRTLLQFVPSVAVQGFRPDYTVISWNEASTRMFGYTADDAMGKDIRKLLVPDDLQKDVTEICDRMAETGITGPSAEQDLLHKDGTRVPVFVSHAVVKIPGKSTTLFCIGVDLTERKKAETALRDAEQRLQSILDVAPFGTFVFEMREDGDLVFISGNQSADSILRTDCSRFAEKTIEEAFPGLTMTAIPDAFRKAARDGKTFQLDAVNYDMNGIKGVFEIHAVPLGQNRIAVFFREISEKKRAEEELAQSETRFRSLIQNSSDIIQILDREKRLVYSSPALSKILGYPEGSQNGTSILNLVHPDDRIRVAADLEEVYSQANRGTPTEYRMIAADGTFLYVESVGVNLFGIPGIDGIVINTHAVHERKLAEQALQESEERFRLIFQNSNDSLYLFEITASGMPGKIVDANEVAIRQTGYTKDELMQKSLLDLCSRDLSQRSRAIMMELLTRGEARFETEKIKKDGSLLPVEISARLAKLKNKTYVIAISRDISRRKREERALRIANQKLQLMNIVAWHDIQNKVTGLRGYVELSKDMVTDEKVKKFIDSEEDVLRVIHRQLQYTKEYQEMGIHPPQWVNLPQVLRMILSFKEIGSLKFRMEIDNLELYCDPVIEKVFSHLIENTRKHGKNATEIRISCEETASGLLLLYEDDGTGIPVQKKKDLFLRGVGSETGFSLFFVHDILEISDMGIRETGEPGKGVRFEISVPRGLYRVLS